MEIPLFLSSCWSRETCICFSESIPQLHSSFMGSSVGREPVYLIAAEKLLNQCFPNSSVPDTLSPDQLQKLPLIFSPTVSTDSGHGFQTFSGGSGLAIRISKVTAGDYRPPAPVGGPGTWGPASVPAMHLRDVRQFLSEGPDAPVLRRLYRDRVWSMLERT